jgi:hypothetical protein
MVRAAETSDEPASGVKPSPIHFSTRYGTLNFPEKFPGRHDAVAQ